MVGIGIDFGTSNSSVARFDGEKLEFVELDPGHAAGAVMPTALYLTRSRDSVVGRRALERYNRDNAGRSVELQREEVGELEIVVAGTDNTKGTGDGGAIQEVGRVHAYTDRALPGRLFRSLKRWLGNPRIDRVRVFDRQYRIVALVTPILAAIERAAGGTADSRTPRVGRPVEFEGRHEGANELALARLRESCGYAGLSEVSFYPEPVAAALSFCEERAEAGSQTLLAFDFGGGTLDLCVMRRHGSRFEVLSTAGAGLGGDAIDALVYRNVVFPELGDGAEVTSELAKGPRRVPFRFELFAERLLNWGLAYELNRPELLERVAQGARESGEAGQRLSRLYDLVTGNLSYDVFRAIERAKVELSSVESATIRVPELGLEVPLTRARFDALLSNMLRDIDILVDRALARSGVGADEIDAVVRTGGSSQIPAVEALLEARFPGRIVTHDPFRSIAAGLAIASYRGIE